MRKRWMAVLFAALLLAGCSPAAPEQTSSPGTTQSVPTTQSLPQTVQTQPTAPEFRELVLVEDENCLFKITAIEENGIFGYTLKAYLENRTGRDLMFSVNNASVNGFMCDPFWATEVSARMKANEEISFLEADLTRNGITEVTDIEFELTVYDSDDWEAERLVEEDFEIYPLGKAAAREYPRQAQPEDIVLFDNAHCTMIITGFDPENMWGYTVNVFLENKTDEDLMFAINGASVNGFMCDPVWAETVAAGKKSNTAISWVESDFSDNGITQVEVLTLPVQVYDSDDWTDAYLVEETFEVRPNS